MGVQKLVLERPGPGPGRGRLAPCHVVVARARWFCRARKKRRCVPGQFLWTLEFTAALQAVMEPWCLQPCVGMGCPASPEGPFTAAVFTAKDRLLCRDR